MKLRLTLLIGLIFSIHLHATPSPTGVDVCRIISNYNPIKGVDCAKIISKSDLSSYSLSLAEKVANINIHHALEILEITANKRFTYNALLVCEKIADINTFSAVDCAKVVSESIYHGSLTNICQEIANINTIQAVECMSIVANKIARNSAEEICLDIAKVNTWRALTCLKDITRESTSPQNKVITLTQSELTEVKKYLFIAQHYLSTGSYENVNESLKEGIKAINLLIYRP